MPAAVDPGAGALTARLPSAFRLRRLTESGIRIGVPRGWIALTRRDAASPGAAQTLARIDPGIKGPLVALAVPDSPLRLLVLAPSPRGRSAALSASSSAPARPSRPRTTRGRRLQNGRCCAVRVRAGACRCATCGCRAGRRCGSPSSERAAASVSPPCRSFAVTGGRMVLLQLATGRVRALGRTLDAMARTLAPLGGSANPGPQLSPSA
jgi:hypothetical protein